MLENFPFSGIVLPAAKLALLMHGLSLFLDAALGEQRLHKKIGQPLHALHELTVGDLEVIIGFVVGCPGIVHA